MMDFIEIAANVTSARGRAVVNNILSNSKYFQVLSVLKGFELDTTISNYIPFSYNSTLATRELGNSFSYTVTTPPNAQSITQAIAGEVVLIDKSYVRDAAIKGTAIEKWLQTELVRRSVAYGRLMDVELTKGSGTSGAIKGLKAILNGTTNIPGFSTTGVVNAANYSTISGAKHLDLRLDQTNFEKEATAFREMLQKITSELDDANVLVCNNTMWSRISTIAGKLNLLSSPTNELLKTPSVGQLNTIVIPDLAYPNDEPDDTTPTALNVTTSIYLLSVRTGALSLVTNGFDYREADYMEMKEASEEKWEMGVAWKIENQNAVRRIRNIRV